MFMDLDFCVVCFLFKYYGVWYGFLLKSLGCFIMLVMW